MAEIAQKAMDLNFDGLMVETHPNPDEAWSDAKQQITPAELASLIEGLVMRSPAVQSGMESELNQLREKISDLDERMFDILASRMRISEEVGAFKREHNITILQQKHWEKVLSKRLMMRDSHQLTETFIRKIMDAIHQESIRHQTKIMNAKAGNKPNSNE